MTPRAPYACFHRVISGRWGVLGVMMFALAASGCTGTASGTLVYDYPATYVDTVPGDIVYYPHVYYHGRHAYWVDGRWYYPSSRGWVVFREEPRELRRYRVYNPHRFEAYPRRYRPTSEYGIPDQRRYRAPQVTPQDRYYRSPRSTPPPPRQPQEQRRYYRPR